MLDITFSLPVVIATLFALVALLGIVLWAKAKQSVNQANTEKEQLLQKLQEATLQYSKAAATIEHLHSQQEQLRQQTEQKQLELEKVQEKFMQLRDQATRLQTELKEREASHQREVESFEQQKQQLSEHFKVLSNDILKAQSRALQETNRQSISASITPFQHSINAFKKELQEIHSRESRQQGELRQELKQLKELNMQVTKEASDLANALHGQKKLQGNWGELILENVLERSGLVLDQDYRREVSFTTEEGRRRPDAIVYLPQNKHLVIDSKVSLNAYTRYVNAETEDERTFALKEHVAAVENHIRELADKDYYQLPGLNSPDMVFMFIPIESAFVEALKADEELFQKAIENHVLVATPTTLLTSLNIVRQLWRFENQNKHMAELTRKAESVHGKLKTFLESFAKVKNSLDTAQEAYSTAHGQLVSGRGNLVKQVDEFKTLVPAISSELPEHYVAEANLEIGNSQELAGRESL